MGAFQPQSLGAWLIATRPISLLLAISPVLVGATLGYQRTGQLNALVALLALSGALLVQLITNLQNDVGYTLRGGEASGQRIGLPRATSSGLLAVRQVQRAIVGLSLVAVGVGLVLVALCGWPVLALGTASLLAALAYMGGPKPIAYTPFGELTVFVFFGLVGVLGTEWVLTGSIGMASVFAAMAVGSIAAAALAVNNHRDQAHDRSVGRNTFAAVFGDRASGGLLTLLLCAPFVAQIAAALVLRTWWWALPCGLLPMVLRLLRDFAVCPPGLAYNPILFRAFKLELWFAALLSLGALLAAQPHAGV
jgi:1,4-dihydroxy-2-naphthoate octaprenyltransferase